MKNRFEDLWGAAADDGASSLVGVNVIRHGDADEVDRLLDAWLRERTERIEGSLVLEEARRLIAGLLADGMVSPRRVRQARRVLQAIRDLDGGSRLS